MIELYYWTTPNGHKITIFLEETGTPYKIVPVNISRGEQFAAHFLQIAPNNRIPAIVDDAPDDGRAPIALFESGEILLYLAEKTGSLLPKTLRGRHETLQWLFWQAAGLGPMAGQTHHFLHYAPERIDYAMQRYTQETNRLYGVLDQRLADRQFIAGDEFTIADIAAYPWILPDVQGQDLDAFPHLARWRQNIRERPAVKRAYALSKTINTQPTVNDAQARKVLFGQTAAGPPAASEA
ncbi:glutathione binding-like protein [Phenylobacterium sp.]|uniref:glutathione binding-like protein n=1 Tax=Phenylobacterium sp. TaxID=1871053 RepID=UPI0035B0BB8D